MCKRDVCAAGKVSKAAYASFNSNYNAVARASSTVFYRRAAIQSGTNARRFLVDPALSSSVDAIVAFFLGKGAVMMSNAR